MFKFQVVLVKDELGGRYTPPQLVSQHKSLSQALRTARSYKGRATVVLDVDGEAYTYYYSKNGKHVFVGRFGDTKEI